jgi:hypothetical protein
MLHNLGLAGIPQLDRGRMCLLVRISLTGTRRYGADSEVSRRLMKDAITSPHGYTNIKVKQMSVAQLPDVTFNRALYEQRQHRSPEYFPHTVKMREATGRGCLMSSASVAVVIALKTTSG